MMMTTPMAFPIRVIVSPPNTWGGWWIGVVVSGHLVSVLFTSLFLCFSGSLALFLCSRVASCWLSCFITWTSSWILVGWTMFQIGERKAAEPRTSNYCTMRGSSTSIQVELVCFSVFVASVVRYCMVYHFYKYKLLCFLLLFLQFAL